jgi:hypothetical protein
MLIAPLLLIAPLQDPAAATAADSIWDRLSFYANGRLRAESTFDQPNDEDRHRGRMRLRAGGLYEISDEWRAEARMTTTADGNDANNPYWDFGDGGEAFGPAEFELDRFLMEWDATSKFQLRGGKFGHAFSRPPVYGEFVWDDDVQPAGVAAIWSPDKEGKLRYDLRAVEYIAVENSADDDAAMFGVQANLFLQTGESTKAQLASSISDWSSLDAGVGSLGNQGNTDVTGDFLVWDSFASVTYDGTALKPLTAFIQYIENLDADTSEDTGYALGAQVGPSSRKGDVSAFAAWYSLDADSLFSPVAQDDTPIAGTGIGTGNEGLMVGVRYFVLDNLSLRLWALTSDADAADDPYRIRFDIDFNVF